ncbi:hypothetical protein ED352_09810 [Muribaculaceae bacterium Isolate-002 (NCI)]|nr:hypothetical protein ED352_09810 [Muribaculaceae bacterium Isolate-002 (NCI)]
MTMDRIIALSEIKSAVENAYESFKSSKEGNVDPALEGVDTKKFGITVTLADGTVISKGDTDVASPLGGIIKLPLSTILLSQNTPEELIKKSGHCPCTAKPGKPHIHGAHGIRAISAIEPTGDPDSKWNFIEDRMTDLMGTAPLLDDKIYEALKKKAIDEDIVNELAKDGYYLYDDATISTDLYIRARSMTATTAQLAMMAATVAADGVNPSTKKIVFDGEIAKHVVGMMAAKGPRKMTLPWDMAAGLPAKSSFGGAIVGVYPGVMGVAAYSPLLMPNRVSEKAAKAIMTFMHKLDISVFQSARLVIDKDK